MGYQVHPAHQERAQENLTDCGFSLQEALQIGPADFQKRTRFARPAAHQTAASGKLVHFTGELSAPQNPKHRVILARNSDNFDTAGEHDKDTVAGVSLVEEYFVRLRQPLLAKLRKSLNLRIVQRGKHRVDLFGRFGHAVFRASFRWSV